VGNIGDNGKREFALEEYRNLRQEIVDKMGKQYQLLGLGVGGITLIMGYIFTTNVYELFFVLPFLIFANAILYKVEKKAIVNAGAYIKKIENSVYRNNSDNSDIESCVEDKVFGNMGWENYLKREEYILCDWAADIIFGSLYIMSVVGAWFCHQEIFSPIIVKLAMFLYLGVIVFWVYLIIEDSRGDKNGKSATGNE